MRPKAFSSLRSLALLLPLLLGSALSSPGNAQVSRADSAAILLEAARTFEREGRMEVAEALFHHITERFGGTPAAAEALTALREMPVDSQNRSAQVELMVWATTYGAWLGVAIPGAFGADSPEPFGVGLLVGGPGGFLAGRALSRSRPMSQGQVRAITFGSLWGTWMGYGVMEVLDWGERKVCDFDSSNCYREDQDGEDVFRSFVVGGLAGTLTGALLARKPIPRGVATAATLAAPWGSWFGLAGGILVDLEGDGLLTSTLIGGNVALLAGAKLASSRRVSRNRARLVSIAGVIGGLVGGGFDLLIQPDDEKAAVAIPLAGSILGLVVGSALTSDMDRPGAEGPSEGLTEVLGGSSLLQLRDGRLSLGAPSPFPTLVPVEDARGFGYRPALGVTLFRGRF